MIWFILIFSLAVVLLFVGGIITTKISQRREVDAEYHAKWLLFEKKTDPVYSVFVNVVGWGFALLVIYFIYLG